MRTTRYRNIKVTRDSMSDWSVPFDEGSSETELQFEFCRRLVASFGEEVRIAPQKTLSDGSIPDLLIQISPSHQQDLITELKNPRVGLNYNKFDQLTCYGQTHFAVDPKLSVLKLVLCNGRSAYVGQISRKDHSEIEVLIADPPLTFYSKKDGVYETNWDDLEKFFKILKSNPEPLKEIYEIPSFGKFSLGNLIGMGAESLVYDIDRKGSNGENLVAKFYQDRDSYRTEISAFNKLKDLNITLPLHGTLPNYCAILTKGRPWKETLGQSPNPKLTLAHFQDLLALVEKMHTKGIIHRDIRAANIYFVGSEVRLGDLASSLIEPSLEEFAGAWTTASQASLEAGIRKVAHEYTHRDDLESVLKTWLLWKLQLTVPCGEPRARKRSAYGFWDELLAICQLDKNATAEELKAYLDDRFSWESPKI